MKKIIFASGPVVVENNKVLLDISGNDDFWKFCGGRVKENEGLIEAAHNRFLEELNMKIEIINPEPYIMYTKKPGNEKIDVILIHWLSRRIGEEKAGETVKEFAWHDINNLPDNLAPNIIPTLKHFKFL